MKIRNGFVSNSSSSSFIVAFKKVPTSCKKLQRMLFGNETKFGGTYRSSPTYDADYIAEVVWQDMQRSGSASKKKIADVIKVGWADDRPDLDEYVITFDDENGREYNWDKYRESINKWANKKAQEFTNENPNCKFYIFSYNDNDSQMYSEMEHGDLFRKLPHLTVNCH
jgi:hypothetical protein